MSTPAAPSFVRTLVPIAVGQVVAYVGTLGVDVPAKVEDAFTVVLGFIVASAYYTAVRFLEQKFPWMGALLGWAVTPDGYSHGDETIDELEIDGDDDVEGDLAEIDEDDLDVDEDLEDDIDLDEADDEDTEDSPVEIPDDFDPHLDDVEAYKADQQATLDAQLLADADDTPPPDDYEPKH